MLRYKIKKALEYLRSPEYRGNFLEYLQKRNKDLETKKIKNIVKKKKVVKDN